MSPLFRDPDARLRDAVASFVKLLIQARLRDESGFLSDEQKHRWHLDELPPSDASIGRLLELALRAYRKITTELNIPSFAVGDDSPPTVEDLIFDFISPKALKIARQASIAGKDIDWDAAVRWEDLDAMRDALDQLPYPRRRHGASRTNRRQQAKGGRPRLSDAEREKRWAVHAAWQKAREARVHLKDFCKDEHLDLSQTAAELNWCSQEARRGRGPTDDVTAASRPKPRTPRPRR